MKIFLFYFEMAIKITGSAQNYRVGRVYSGNTPIFFRPYACPGKVWQGITDRPDMTSTVYLGRYARNQTKTDCIKKAKRPLDHCCTEKLYYKKT